MNQKEFFKFQAEERAKKYHNIFSAMIKMKNLEELKGIDNKNISLISIEKRGAQFLIGIEEEVQDGFGYFNKQYQECVSSIDDAITFFDNKQIGEIIWLKKNKKIVA